MSFPSLPIPICNITLVPGVYKLGEKWMMVLSNVSLIYLNNLISSDHFIYLNNITFELQIENSLKEVHFSGYNTFVWSKHHIEVNFFGISGFINQQDRAS